MPNGVKVGIMLEETGLDYEPQRIDITASSTNLPAKPINALATLFGALSKALDVKTRDRIGLAPAGST
jgi:hypothetical protein